MRTSTCCAPAPARTTAPGRPVAPGGGATPFQQAEYHHSLTHWRAEVTSARQAVTTRTDASLAAWARGLDIAGKVGRLPAPARSPGSLAGECSAAASALAGLGETGGAGFGGRRVVLLYASSLAVRSCPANCPGTT